MFVRLWAYMFRLHGRKPCMFLCGIPGETPSEQVLFFLSPASGTRVCTQRTHDLTTIQDCQLINSASQNVDSMTPGLCYAACTDLYIVWHLHDVTQALPWKHQNCPAAPYSDTMMQNQTTQYLQKNIMLSNHVSADAYVHLLTAPVHCCGTYLQ